MSTQLLQKVLDHYLKFGLYTDPGLYEEKLEKDLPNDVREIGKLVRNQLIHQVQLKDFKNKLPWYRQPEDGILATASSMLGELYRRDSRGFVMDRAAKDQLILTCRPVSILMASILKSKGIPARVRSGFAPYFKNYGDKSVDHWVNEYWNKKEQRWVMIDIDGLGVLDKFDPFDIPPGIFDYSADAWLKSRSGQVDPHHFWNAIPESGLMMIAWELFYDLHCLMNSEIIYPYHPRICSPDIFPTLKEEKLKEIDDLAKLMQSPDEHFEKLLSLWNSKEDFRMLKGLLLYGT